MANLAKYWNPKPTTGVSQMCELFVALKRAYCIQNNANVFLKSVDSSTQEGRRITCVSVACYFQNCE